MIALPLCRTIPLAYGALLLVLALSKAREHWKLNGFSGSRLVLVLIRDQAFYYAMYVFLVIRSWSKLISLLKRTLLFDCKPLERWARQRVTPSWCSACWAWKPYESLRSWESDVLQSQGGCGTWGQCRHELVVVFAQRDPIR